MNVMPNSDGRLDTKTSRRPPVKVADAYIASRVSMSFRAPQAMRF